MKFSDVLSLVGDLPFFETELLLVGDIDPNNLRRQISRWEQTGKLHQLRRGLYALAPPYNKTIPHPFLVANALVTGSYVSGQSALAYYGLIPEYAPRVTSVTLTHPSQWDGGFTFQHLARRFFFGYQSLEVMQGQHAFVAHPEKALLDLAHLTPASDSVEYLSQLRLQNLERLNLERLTEYAARANKPKWERVARQVLLLVEQDTAGYEDLP